MSRPGRSPGRSTRQEVVNSIFKVVPPRSVVRLTRFDRSVPAWKKQVGKRFRIGYYNPTHGLGEVWLVDDRGAYVGTATQAQIRRYFAIERLSKDTDYFGLGRRRLSYIGKQRRAGTLRVRARREKTTVELPREWSGRIIDRFKWPLKPHLKNLYRILKVMELSRLRPPRLHYYIWPDKMRGVCFEGNLSSFFGFIEGKIKEESTRLRQKVEKGSIEDWQILFIRSSKIPDILWIASHRIYFSPTSRPDIWPHLAIQRLKADHFAAWMG